MISVYVCVCVYFSKVNFFSYVQMAWKALDALEQSKGSLVIVSSLLGRFVTASLHGDDSKL